MSDQQVQQRSQAEILAKVKATARRVAPSAVAIDVTTTDQHVGYGFVLTDAYGNGRTLRVADPKGFLQLDEALCDDLADLDWDGVVGEDRHGYAAIPLLRRVPIGATVIHADGVFRYDGPTTSSGAFSKVVFTLGECGLQGLRCDVSQVALATAPVPDKDDRVVVVRRERGQYPTWKGPWELSASGQRYGFHKTKRDATATGLRVLAIADWHASAPEPAAAEAARGDTVVCLLTEMQAGYAAELVERAERVKSGSKVVAASSEVSRREVAGIQVAVTEVVWRDGGRSFEVHRTSDGLDLTEDGCFDEWPDDAGIAVLLSRAQTSTDGAGRAVAGTKRDATGLRAVAVRRTAYDDYATVLCSCGTSLHDYPGSRQAHEDERHSAQSPARYGDPVATNTRSV